MLVVAVGLKYMQLILVVFVNVFIGVDVMGIVVIVFGDFVSTVVFVLPVSLFVVASTYRTVITPTTISLPSPLDISSFVAKHPFTLYQVQSQTGWDIFENCERYHFTRVQI